MHRRLLVLVAATALAPGSPAFAGGLDGSLSSMEGQHAVARKSDYSFLGTPADVKRLVELGRLVEVPGNADYSLSKVSFPYARAEVLAFIEGLAADYREFTGYQLVVTSLTRPEKLQPRNAHALSVHPAGMAVDLRIPAAPERREWLEARLLELEDAGAIDVTRERNPPHYHVAVFAEKLAPIAARHDSLRIARRLALAEAAAARLAVQDGVVNLTASTVPATGTDRRRAPLLLATLTAMMSGVPIIRRHRRRSTDSVA